VWFIEKNSKIAKYEPGLVGIQMVRWDKIDSEPTDSFSLEVEIPVIT
jgi:hypothetical protein